MAANGNFTQQQLPGNVFNTGNGGIVNWDGQAVRVSNPGNGTRDIEQLGDWNQYQSQQQATQLAQQQQAQYQQANQQAIGGLQQKKTDLAGQYSDLLANVTQQYQPYVDQGEAYANEALGKRGLTPDSALFQQQKQGMLAPYLSQRLAGINQITQGSVADTNSLASQIAQMQQGGAQFSAQLPLQYGSLSNAQQLLPAQIQQYLAQSKYYGAQAQAAPFIPIPSLGVYDINQGSLLLGGAGASNQALSGQSGLFKYVK